MMKLKGPGKLPHMLVPNLHFFLRIISPEERETRYTLHIFACFWGSDRANICGSSPGPKLRQNGMWRVLRTERPEQGMTSVRSQSRKVLTDSSVAEHRQAPCNRCH